MRIIALETSSSACSVALLDGDTLIGQHQLLPQQHGQFVLEWIFFLLKERELTISQLEGVCYSAGPGGFTGIRISAAVAQGISLGGNIPMLSIPSLQVIAQGIYRQHGHSQVTIILDARMQQVYYGQYSLDDEGFMMPSIGDQLLSYQKIPLQNGQFHPCLVTDASSLAGLAEFCPTNYFAAVISDFYPNAVDVLALGKRSLSLDPKPSMNFAMPVYLRSEDSWKKI